MIWITWNIHLHLRNALDRGSKVLELNLIIDFMPYFSFELKLIIMFLHIAIAILTDDKTQYKGNCRNIRKYKGNWTISYVLKLTYKNYNFFNFGSRIGLQCWGLHGTFGTHIGIYQYDIYVILSYVNVIIGHICHLCHDE